MDLNTINWRLGAIIALFDMCVLKAYMYYVVGMSFFCSSVVNIHCCPSIVSYV